MIELAKEKTVDYVRPSISEQLILYNFAPDRFRHRFWFWMDVKFLVDIPDVPANSINTNETSYRQSVYSSCL